MPRVTRQYDTTRNVPFKAVTIEQLKIAAKHLGITENEFIRQSVERMINEQEYVAVTTGRQRKIIADRLDKLEQNVRGWLNEKAQQDEAQLLELAERLFQALNTLTVTVDPAEGIVSTDDMKALVNVAVDARYQQLSYQLAAILRLCMSMSIGAYKEEQFAEHVKRVYGQSLAQLPVYMKLVDGLTRAVKQQGG